MTVTRLEILDVQRNYAVGISVWLWAMLVGALLSTTAPNLSAGDRGLTLLGVVLCGGIRLVCRSALFVGYETAPDVVVARVGGRTVELAPRQVLAVLRNKKNWKVPSAVVLRRPGLLRGVVLLGVLDPDGTLAELLERG